MASATDTVKPEAARGREHRRWTPPGSRLGRLIIVLNLLGLMILIGGALVLNELSRGLINAKIDSLTTQGEFIANVHRTGRHPRRSGAARWTPTAPATPCSSCSSRARSGRGCSTPAATRSPTAM